MPNDDLQSVPRRRSPWTAIGLGLLLAAPLPALSYLAYKAFGAPFVAFDVFDWMTRNLPGGLVTFGIDTMVQTLVAFGFDLKDTAKLAEQLMAVFGFYLTAAVVATVYFYLMRHRGLLRALALGAWAGVIFALPVALISLDVWGTATVGRFVGGLWIFVLFALWGLGLGWTHVRTVPQPQRAAAEPERVPAAPAEGEAETSAPAATAEGAAPAVRAYTTPERPRAEAGGIYVERVSRRRFLVEIAGTAAAITVVGAGVATYLRLTETTPQVASGPPIPAPNADATVQPVPGTRPEYTPLPEHYRIDINTIPPRIDAENWQLEIRGLVDQEVNLTLDEIRTDFTPVRRFITLGCISNPIGGPLISTTLWTGARLSEVLDRAGVQPNAGYVHITSDDGFYETLPLELLRSDDRIMLTYNFDGQDLPQEHGYPLRIWIPNKYGMKQPKWIIGLELTADYSPGYWVERGWSREAIINTTSVIDIVATDEVSQQNGRQVVPVGGIAWAGDRGVQRVQVRVDGGEWDDAELREPLSDVTWVIWRYSWPFTSGEHTLEVRAQDGTGEWQVAESSDTYPDGATGLHSYVARVEG